MDMTGRQTVLITDIVGFEIANQHGFIVPDRFYRLGRA
jgi:hypothetical protein